MWLNGYSFTTVDFHSIDELSIILEMTSNGNKYSYYLMEISYSYLKSASFRTVANVNPTTS